MLVCFSQLWGVPRLSLPVTSDGDVADAAAVAVDDDDVDDAELLVLLLDTAASCNVQSRSADKASNDGRCWLFISLPLVELLFFTHTDSVWYKAG